METNPIVFSGSIPQLYEDYLGPFLFEPFALDIANRIGQQDRSRHVLELACGTGRLTRHLLARLGKSDLLTATDINPEMMAVAREKIQAHNLLWNIADITDIPYQENFFDLIVCQFGLMLVPEKDKALAEIARVMKKNGRFLFNVWGDRKANGIWSIGMKVIGSFLGGNPIPQNAGPFSMEDDQETIRLLKEAGFRDIKATSVSKTGVIASAGIAAKGFIEGLPIAQVLRQRDPSLINRIEGALAKELTDQLGDQPLQSPLLAWVFEAVK